MKVLVLEKVVIEKSENNIFGNIIRKYGEDCWVFILFFQFYDVASLVIIPRGI
jgi:hypothetical protein